MLLFAHEKFDRHLLIYITLLCIYYIFRSRNVQSCQTQFGATYRQIAKNLYSIGTPSRNVFVLRNKSVLQM